VRMKEYDLLAEIQHSLDLCDPESRGQGSDEFRWQRLPLEI